VKVQVQLFATLTVFLPQGGHQGVATLEVPERSTVRDLVQRLGLPTDLERVTLVNGSDALPERALHHDDVVAIFPPLAGGQG
jgi:molybdopterin converting factor small subunit